MAPENDGRPFQSPAMLMISDTGDLAIGVEAEQKAPLPNVASHVVQAEAIRWEGAHRRSANKSIFAMSFIALSDEERRNIEAGGDIIDAQTGVNNQIVECDELVSRVHNRRSLAAEDWGAAVPCRPLP